jgi:long-chain acyl-CoA synthetase
MNIAAGIAEFGRAMPAAVAVVDGERRLTYAALDERANRVANLLLASGVRPGERAAVLCGNRLEYPELAAGCARAGLAMVPINPRLTAGEVAYQMEHSGARALFLDDALAEAAAPSVEAADLALVCSIGGSSLGPEHERSLTGADAAPPRIETAETEPFCVAYTSGTTGRPKGVVISHRSRCLTFYCSAIEWGLGPGRRTIAVAPMYHGAGFAFAFAALHTGGSVAMLRAFDPEGLLAMIGATGAETVFLVPAHAQMIRALGDGALAGAGLATLETLFFNAAPLPDDLKRWVMDSLPPVGLHELYGSTEAGIVTDLRPQDQRRKTSCVGPPWFMTELRIVADDGTPVALGERGELFSRSPFLMNGYLADEEATAACSTADGYLSSGDVAVRDEEGFVYIVDRKKDLIISGGVNISPREIEEVLMAHPDVADAAVIGVASSQFGEQVTAFVVAAGGHELDVPALDAHCRVSLAGFKIPRSWRVVDALPRSAAGKVLKTELRALEAKAGADGVVDRDGS